MTDSKHVPTIRVKKQLKAIRIAIVAVGLLTLLLSVMAISSAIALLRTRAGDGLSDASIVVLLLGLLLAIGGVTVVLRGIKHGTRAA